MARPKGSKDSKPRRNAGETELEYQLRINNMEPQQEPQPQPQQEPQPQPQQEPQQYDPTNYNQSTEANDNDVYDILSEYAEEEDTQLTPPDIQKQAPENPDYKISGIMMLGIVDIFMPSLFIKFYSWTGKALPKHITADKISLSDMDKKELREIADIVANQYLKGFSPLLLLITSLSAVYMSNIKALLNE